MKPWLDEEQIQPGRSFQEEIQKAIPQIQSAAIFIGLTGLGRWQVLELQTLTSQFINNGIPVIPVLLPGVDKIPDNLLFLQQFNWVSFENIDDAAALYKLEWGITGIKPRPQPKQSLSNEVELKSEKGIDYTKLRDLLEQQKWKSADKETYKVMLQAAGREKEGWLDIDSIDNFPCEDLRTINQLWLHYSKGKFGFSVQKKIYEELGGTREYNEKVWKDFGERVGWRKGGNWLGNWLHNDQWLNYDQLTFNLNAPQAHLPCLWLDVVGMWVGYVNLSDFGMGEEEEVNMFKFDFGGEFSSLARRLVTCKI